MVLVERDEALMIFTEYSMKQHKQGADEKIKKRTPKGLKSADLVDLAQTKRCRLSLFYLL